MLAALPSSALAQSTSVRIVIPRGSTCFNHAGRGTTFIGDFRAGQTLTVTGSQRYSGGEGALYFDIVAPGGQRFELAPDDSTIRTPRPGSYVVIAQTDTPRMPTRVRICAR